MLHHPIIKQILNVKWFEVFPIMCFTLMTKHLPCKVGQWFFFTSARNDSHHQTHFYVNWDANNTQMI